MGRAFGEDSMNAIIGRTATTLSVLTQPGPNFLSLLATTSASLA